MVETSEYPSIRMALSAAWLAGVQARRAGGPCEPPRELAGRMALVREWETGWHDGGSVPRMPPLRSCRA